MSNFAFLHIPEWSFLYESASKAEELANTDARASCFYSRRALELAVAWLYKYDRSLRVPYQDNLSALIHEPTFRDVVGDMLFTKVRLIKDLGNMAVHSSRKIGQSDAVNTSRELFHFCYWLVRTYGRTQRPNPGLSFDLTLLPKATSAPTQSAEQLKQLEENLKATDENLSKALADKATLNEELNRLREELVAIKQGNTAQPDTHDYSEDETRKLYIDVLLKEAGWLLDPIKNFEVEVTGMPNNEGKGFVDYVLWGDDGKPLALIEAKRTTRNPSVGQQQAKLYADCLETMYGQRPIIFYTNGYEHWIWDDKTYPPREVQGFYKKQELENLIQRRTSKKTLISAEVNKDIIERPYQMQAVRRVSESFEKDRQRKALLVMATGTGKTRTVIAMADLLMRCNWAKRVLFLADRVALVNQAVNAFKVHLPDASPVNLVTDKEAQGRVYVSTYPTMMGLIDDSSDGQRRFGVGHFDLIIIDEAHRSVYRKYKAIFDYFDCLLVGLTATPKDEIDHNTYSLFELETGVPTDAYSLNEAVEQGYLVPPIGISIESKFQREGIKYNDLSEAEKEQWDELDWSQDGEVPDEVNSAALNKWLFNESTVDEVLGILMTKGQKVAGGDRLGKTIIFAKNNDHADFIARRFDANYPHYAGHFARVVTYKTEYAQSLIDDFSAKDKMPHIAISVDMLDTGIDVPEVVNLVFFKLVRSRTKFWQMVGRGTRLCKDLFAPGQDKQSFYIFDFCQNIEFFSQDLNMSDGVSAEPLSTRLFRGRLQLIAELDKVSAAGEELKVRDEVADYLHGYVAAMNLNNFVVRPQRRHVEKFANKDAWTKLSAESLHEMSKYVAVLPTELNDIDEEEAKRFDMLILRAQLAAIQADSKTLKELKIRVQNIVSMLEEQTSIPAIQAQLVFIHAVMTDEWWQDVNISMLEALRKKLRGLVHLLPKSQKKIVYTNFIDNVVAPSPTPLPIPGGAGVDMAKFKEKARAFMRQHDSNLALQRLRRNLQLTTSDLDELEKMLIEAGGSSNLIEAAKKEAQNLGIFVRSLVGLDRAAAQDAFSEFLNDKTFTPNQHEFVSMVIEELTQTGVVDPKRLFEAPYTNINAKGVLAIFPQAKATKIIDILETIKSRAAA
jgi:type I restriction enzyme, R subunit